MKNVQDIPEFLDTNYVLDVLEEIYKQLLLDKNLTHDFDQRSFKSLKKELELLAFEAIKASCNRDGITISDEIIRDLIGDALKKGIFYKIHGTEAEGLHEEQIRTSIRDQLGDISDALNDIGENTYDNRARALGENGIPKVTNLPSEEAKTVLLERLEALKDGLTPEFYERLMSVFKFNDHNLLRILNIFKTIDISKEASGSLKKISQIIGDYIAITTSAMHSRLFDDVVNSESKTWQDRMQDRITHYRSGAEETDLNRQIDGCEKRIYNLSELSGIVRELRAFPCNRSTFKIAESIDDLERRIITSEQQKVTANPQLARTLDVEIEKAKRAVEVLRQSPFFNDDSYARTNGLDIREDLHISKILSLIDEESEFIKTNLKKLIERRAPEQISHIANELEAQLHEGNLHAINVREFSRQNPVELEKLYRELSAKFQNSRILKAFYELLERIKFEHKLMDQVMKENKGNEELKTKIKQLPYRSWSTNGVLVWARARLSRKSTTTGLDESLA